MFFTIICTITANFVPIGHLIMIKNGKRHRKSHLKNKKLKKALNTICCKAIDAFV